MQKFCLALDLKNDKDLIKAYEKYHEEVWPEIINSIKDSGIVDMEIYRIENRLFMIIIANDDFTFKKKEKLDRGNKMVKKWEELMWIFQQALPTAKKGEKWMLMNKIFDFKI
jgi:L-rhamnose mutarotase